MKRGNPHALLRGHGRALLLAAASLLLLRLTAGHPEALAPAPVGPPGMDPAAAVAQGPSGLALRDGGSGRRRDAAASGLSGAASSATLEARIAGGPLPGAEGAAAEAPPSRWTNRDGPLGAQVLDARDLRVLSDLAAANGLGEDSSPRDYDDGDGVLEPHEIGLQVWRDGRLVALSTGEDRYGSFGYQLRVLPASLGDLDALEELDLHTNQLVALPESVGTLGRLQVLRLHRNTLAGLPPSIGMLAALEELSLGENVLAELPPGIGALGSLKELHLNDNPLLWLPDSVGSLASLRVLNVSHARAVDPARIASVGGPGEDGKARLAELPPGVSSLERLETLLLAGNRLFCAGGVADPGLAPARLRDGSIPRLHGITAQDCGDPISP